MHIPAALTAELSSLTETLGDPAVDLLDALDSLAQTAALAFNSFAGLTMTAVAGGEHSFTLTAMKAPTISVIGASIKVQLPIHAPPTFDADGSADVPVAAAGSVTFYAGAPGAFIDLAADITWLSGTSAGVVLDQDLTPPDQDRGSGLETIVVINQAIGVLLARGYLPEQGRQQLDIWAVQRGGNRLGAARWLLTELDGHDPTA